MKKDDDRKFFPFKYRNVSRFPDSPHSEVREITLFCVDRETINPLFQERVEIHIMEGERVMVLFHKE